MNRTFALFLAIIVLIAHMLAIHKTSIGLLAPPYELAHVAFRIGRNFVRSGEFAWAPGTPGWESYPSLSWIGLAALAERTYRSVNAVVQVVGASSAVFTVAVLAQFSRSRLAGVIAPLLFVVSGSVAAAAASGTEATTFALFVALAFLAFEERWKGTFAVSLALACLTRPEGVVLALALVAMELVRVVRDSRRRAGGELPSPRGSILASFVPALLVSVGVGIARLSTVGTLSSPWAAAILHPEPGQWRQGLLYLVDFLRASGSSILLPVPLWYLLRRSLSPRGARALGLVGVWFALTVLTGGGSLPFFHDMVPILAVMFVAVQDGMTVALDSKRIGPQVTWVLFLLAMFLSGLASKYPGDLGPLPTEHLHRAWMHPRAEPPLGYEGALGRLGQTEEIQTTERLRTVGVILRDQLDPHHSILTPWPGAIGYLSRLTVIDALGRTTPAAGTARTRSWTGRPRVDVVAALQARPDYVLPVIRVGPTVPSRDAIAQAWTNEIDTRPDDPDRRGLVAAELEPYELIVIPTNGEGSRWNIFLRNRFYLLRRRALDLRPLLHVTVEGRSYRVEVEHRSHDQLVDLSLRVVDSSGHSLAVAPSGALEPAHGQVARSSILLFPTGTRRVELIRGELPEDVEARELRAVLRNPHARGDYPFSLASEEVVAPVGG